MSNTFLLLRYFAFALFVAFSAVICVVAAVNLGTLTPNTPRAPEVDSYLIFLGALGLLIVFPIIFVELIRKNAFIARVFVEITWVSLLWVMHLSGAAAVTAITPQLLCSASGSFARADCPWASSAKVLLAFTWLCTLTLLSYLLTLVISAIYHHQEDSNVWRSGVRDYRWFAHRKSLSTPTDAPFSYGKLVDPKESYGPPRTIYAEQMGLAGTYAVEPLKIESSIERPIPPVPAASSGSRLAPKDGDAHGADHFPSSMPASLSLYPQHLQANVGNLPAVPARVGERTPPPAGSWPRSNPQEPFRKKPRPAPGAASIASSAVAPAPIPASTEPDMAQREGQVITLSSASRSRPSGPRTPSTSRPRPPPLDLSRFSFHNEPQP